MIQEIDELIEQYKYQEALNFILGLDWTLYDDSILMYKAAWLLNRLDKYNQAIYYFERLIAIGKKDIKLYSEYGFALNRSGRIDDAIEALFTAKDLGRDDAWIYGELALCYLNLRFYEEVIEFASEILKKEEEEAYIGTYSLLGEASDGLLKYDEALEYYDKAISCGRNDLWVYCMQARAYISMSSYDKALESLDIALSIDNESSWAYSLLGYVYSSEQETQKALEYYLKAKDYGRHDLWILLELLFVYKRLNNYNEALVYLDLIAQENPLDDQLYLEYFYVYINLNQYEKALDCLEQLVNKEDNDYNHRKGYVLNKLGRYEEALTYLNLVEKETEFLHKDFASVYVSLKLFTKAIEQLEKVLKLNDKDLWCYNQLGKIYIYLKKYDLAEKNLKIVLELDPLNINAISQLFVVCFDTNKLVKAYQLLIKAYELGRSDAWIFYKLAVVNTTLYKDYDASINWLKKSEEINGDDLLTMRELAWTYRVNNQIELGEVYVNELLGLDGKDGWLYSEACEYAVLNENYEKAIYYILMAEKLGRKDNYLFYKKFLIYKELDLYKDALINLEKAMELNHVNLNNKKYKKEYLLKVKKLTKVLKGKNKKGLINEECIFNCLQINNFEQVIDLLSNKNELTLKQFKMLAWSYYRMNDKDNFSLTINKVKELYPDQIWVIDFENLLKK